MFSRIWKRAINEKKMSAAKKDLQQNLFLLDPAFQQSMRQLNVLCISTSECRLCELDRSEAYSLPELLSTLESTKETTLEASRNLRLGQLLTCALAAVLRVLFGGSFGCRRLCLLRGFRQTGSETRRVQGNQIWANTDQFRHQGLCDEKETQHSQVHEIDDCTELQRPQQKEEL